MNYRGTYHIRWPSPVGDRVADTQKFADRWGEATELWKLTDKAYNDRWHCFIIKKATTPKWECKEAHIINVIDEEDNWELLYTAYPMS